MKLRMKYANHVVMHGPVKARRSVNNQIKFLENLHEKINMMLITYNNSQAKIGACETENLSMINTSFSRLCLVRNMSMERERVSKLVCSALEHTS